ncbi:MAG: signal peptidase I [Lachnospiraceae bacterium]|nr:signal peptidase I [Lachnospiraceae bacterium]
MIKKICNIISSFLLILLFIIAILLIGPNILGMKGMAVLSGSMEPSIPVGSIVYVKETELEELKLEDVITYSLPGGTYVTHRITDINTEENTLITKGDANEVNDASPVSFAQVVGKMVFHVPLLGFISICIKTPLGIAVGCGVLIIVILLTYLPDALQEEENKEKKKGERKR